MTNTPIECFLNLFQEIAGDVAEAWCGDRKALRRLFKGTAYGQRHKDWFLSDEMPLPRRTMQHQDYRVLRQLLAVTHDRMGGNLVSQTALKELDRAHAKYISAMDANDARRHRQLTGRTLHLEAAHDRIERFLHRHGYTFAQIIDLDFSRFFFGSEIVRLLSDGQFQECIRLARAFCMLLEKRPELLKHKQNLRNVYAARCAIYGRWAALHCNDMTAQVEFISYLQRLNSCFPDHAIQAILWSDGAARGHIPDGHIKSFNTVSELQKTEVWSAHELGPYPLHGSAADDALKLGASLTERIKILGGQTPEQLFRRAIESKIDDIEIQRDACPVQTLSLYCCRYSYWLSRCGRIEDTWSVIGVARHYLRKSQSSRPYAEICLKESEALAHKALWELSGTPSPLIQCVKGLEEAAQLAQNLNLNNKAQRLRELQPN